MRRAVPVAVVTAGGLVLLSNFHTTPAAVGSAAGAPPVTAPLPITSSPAGPPSTTRRGTTSTTVSPSAPHTVAGPVVATDYGDVQVQITLDSSGRLTDVQALQLPSDRSRSRRISDAAGPILRSEALKAQSANIDIVSGASYTSQGYAESLQGALDRAHR